MRNILIAIVVGLSLTGCATKQYGRVQNLSDVEKDNYTCREITLELEKVRQFERQINETGKFDFKTALGFLGDFGIGNGMAKSDARESARARLLELETLQARKNCSIGIDKGSVDKKEN